MPRYTGGMSFGGIRWVVAGCGLWALACSSAGSDTGAEMSSQDVVEATAPIDTPVDTTPDTTPDTPVDTTPEVKGVAGGTAEPAGEPVAEPTPSLTTVTPQAAKDVIDAAPENLVVLDVRTASEFAMGHLAGAIQVDSYADDFETQLSALDRGATYVLYCRSGNRSGQTMPIMERLGFAEVYEVGGGIVAWMTAGLPVEM